ncbi:squamous cell carcinoma antigen recognized by T-cells 3-like [Lepeophtheirus salmonis]|uniref:squamous cell carcinoma antigen recognized by T-cells 3-like n=1 Tax=Lepeophtheirus salmonis TaxID=72036 RepID=UPI001AE4B0F7|nr:squamous cell carcinoma antigen recognized by T-cells 3-like [Lepeophtheirus salmonis]
MSLEEMDQDGDLVNDEQDNDSLDDEDMEDAREKELNEKLKAVNETLKNNPYDYQSHIDKISVLKSLGELEELRLARQTFSKLYPLSVELWLTWLQDEQRLASSPKERKEVCHLFKRAVQDYLSVDIWIEYCSFILGDVGSADGVSSAREVFEEAVAAIGLHVGKGYLIWGAYRDFEVAVMNLHNKGYEFVFKVFQRQLAIPLLNMEKSIEELKDFEDIPDFKRFSSSSSLSSVYQNSLKKLRGKEEFENALLQTVGDSEANFIKYSEYIQALRDNKSSSPPEIQNLYERRITDHCLNPISWIEYLNYLDSVLKIQSIAMSVYRRAIRNCPWSGNLWCNYIRALEVYGSDLKEITKVFEEALASGFSDPVDYSRIWINYISYFRRKIDDGNESEDSSKAKTDLKEIFERAIDHLDGIPNSDPELKLSRFWASVSGDRLRDMETARKCWAKIVHLIGDRMIYWTEYVTLEKLYGDSKHLRKVFLRGMEKIKDFPDYFAHLWRQFELEEGDLTQLQNAEDKIRKCLLINEERLAKKTAQTQEFKKSQSEKIEKKKDKDKDRRREKRRFEAEDRQTQRKRKMGVIEPQGFQVIIEEDDDNGGKKLKKDSDENVFKAPFPFENKALYQRNIEETQIKHLSGCSQMKENEGAVKPPPGYTQPEGTKKTVKPPPGYQKEVKPPPGFKSQHKSTAEIENGSGSGRPNPEFKDKEESDRTIFLSNLSFEVTEEEIREMMESSGPVKEVRLAKNFNGKSRGFAYVDFVYSESVSKSILRDNELLKERPVYISMCDPNKKGHQFKYATVLEKNKLFVRGLNFSTSKEDLIELFSTYGKVKEVRVVTFRNGKSKGIAYVDFENESDATNAIMKIDGMNFMGHFINVAFSNPPEKKKDMEPVSCLGGGVLKKQAPFLPRSILSKTRDVTEGSSTSSTANTTPKSNADFRNLLLKK